MKTAAISFAAAAMTSAVLTPVVRDLAIRRGWLDQVQSSRKVHRVPIPRTGGIAIVAAFYVPLIALFFTNSSVGQRFYSSPGRATALIVGGVIIAALGVWDDLRGARARMKFLVQFAVAAMVYALGYRIDVIENPFGPAIELGFLGLPFTMLWIAGVINAVNLIDGLDGLAGGVAFIALATLFVVSLGHDVPLMVVFIATLAGAVLGFLRYNFNPASVFMGDTGSMFLGFVLATTAIRSNQSTSSSVAMLVPILALGVPIADTLLAMGRRAARGAPLFAADRGHIHHRLLDLGLTHRQTVLVLYGVSVSLGAGAILFAYAPTPIGITVLIALAGVMALGLRKLGFIRMPPAEQLMDDRRRNIETRNAIRRIGDRLRGARRIEDVWGAARLGREAVGACGVALVSVEDEISTSEGFEPHDPGRFEVRFELVTRRFDAELRLGWRDGRQRLDRDTEIAIELLCEHLGSALDRVGGENSGAHGGRLAKLGS